MGKTSKTSQKRKRIIAGVKSASQLRIHRALCEKGYSVVELPVDEASKAHLSQSSTIESLIRDTTRKRFRVFQSAQLVDDGKSQSVITDNGDSKRFNAPLAAVKSTVTQHCCDDVLVTVDGVVFGIYPELESRRPAEVLASGAGCLPQTPHADGDRSGRLGKLSEKIATAVLSNEDTSGLIAPLSAVIALSQPATMLLSPYSRVEENALLKPESKRVYPKKLKSMLRIRIPAWHCILFRQDVVHAGDGYDQAHVRLHSYYEIPGWTVKPDTTWAVAGMGKKVAAYYRYPRRKG